MKGIGMGIVDTCLSGFNTCLFAYGQTGSGKTFTMMGYDSMPKPHLPSNSLGVPLPATPSTGSAIMSHAAQDSVCEVDRGGAGSESNPCSADHKTEPGMEEEPAPLHFSPWQKSRDCLEPKLSSENSATAPSPGGGEGENTPWTSATEAEDRKGGREGSVATALGPGPMPVPYPPPSVQRLLEGNMALPHTSSSPHGLIPRLCHYLFERVLAMGGRMEGGGDSVKSAPSGGDGVGGPGGGLVTQWSVRVSFTEIYLEKVRDLLNDNRPDHSLKVREHPMQGPFVAGVRWVSVSSASEMDALLVEGQGRRVVAGTNMNETSSRSHAIFAVEVVCTQTDPETGAEGSTVSKVMNLVDLAGSENSNMAGSTGVRLKEGAAINKSLLTLGRVIKALAAAAGSGAESCGPGTQPLSPSSPRRSDATSMGIAASDDPPPPPSPLSR
ncbi:unnamed protein product [Discosporangium mesarthrocarpum]